jgi:soluble lytic murein transglycosylase
MQKNRGFVTPKLGASLRPRKSSMVIGAYGAKLKGVVAALYLVGAGPVLAQTARPVPPVVPVPTLQAAEIEHTARFDGFVAPVRALALGADDAIRLRDAFKAIAANNPALARSLRDQLGDRTARTLVDWAIYRGNGGGAARDIRAFAESHPEWPDQSLLATRADEQTFFEGGDLASIKMVFKGEEPKSAAGQAALASAQLAAGNEAAAKALAAKAWRSHDLAANVEPRFLSRFQSLLTVADHLWRLDRVLIDDTRWAADRMTRVAAATRLLPLLPEAERRKADARIAIYLRRADAAQLMAALPVEATPTPTTAKSSSDWGFLHGLAQWHRRSGRPEAAWPILLAAPVDPTKTPNLDGWWEERRAGAYEALKRGKAQIAYDLVRDPGPLSVNPLKDATFLAGWIAFRHLNDPKRAEPHFAAFAKAADGPLSRSKAAYWRAKLADATGDTSAAVAHRKTAAGQIDTFYGMLARIELNPKASAIKIGPPTVPTSDQVQAFNVHPVVRAAVLSKKAALDATVTRSLFNHLRQIMTTEAEVAMVAHLADALGEPQTALRIAKSAVARGQNLLYYAYPLKPMPSYQPYRAPPEPAFMLSIARQESEFNTNTLSGAGARGLLQVMPVTAEHVCRDYKVKCEIPRLMTDKSYNASMASAYIADRMDEFQGSYVLTLSGYNAGPGRTRQWVREFGDPRDGKMDPVDWIHRIPFEETREYVQKVLSNIQIYRARLGDEATALRLASDLKRLSSTPTRQAAPQPTGAQPKLAAE